MNDKIASLYVVHFIFLVSDQEKEKDKDKKKTNDYPDYPDLSDSDIGTSNGAKEEEYSSTETEESEERKPPQKATKRQELPTPSMKQQTLTQSYPCTPVISPVAAKNYSTENDREGNFMPPFFIAPYKTDAVNIMLVPSSCFLLELLLGILMTFLFGWRPIQRYYVYALRFRPL